MTNTPLIRWGMIGCGSVTDSKSAPAYQQVSGFELSGVCSRTHNKALDYAQKRNIPHVFDSPEALIRSTEIDAVYIATPPDSHHQYALLAAQAGKPCVVEKPMAVTHAQCVQMQQAFERTKTPLFVAYYRRCLPAFNAIKTWLEQGSIGEVRHVNWMYSRSPTEIDLSGAYNWRTDERIAPGGYFDDIACHGLDLFTYYWGQVSHVSGISQNQQHLYSAKDAIAATMLFKSGVTFTGHWNFAASDRTDKVIVTGSKGTLEFGVFDENPAIITSGGEQTQLSMDKPTPIQGDFVQAVANHLFKGIPHPSQGSSATHTSWIMEQILTNT